MSGRRWSLSQRFPVSDVPVTSYTPSAISTFGLSGTIAVPEVFQHIRLLAGDPTLVWTIPSLCQATIGEFSFGKIG